MLVIKTALRPSPIHGLGVFSLENLSEGALIDIPSTLDRVMPARHIHLLPEMIQKKFLCYAYYDGERYTLPWDESRYINHSATPNTRLEKNSMQLVAAREIQPGEEITCNYRDYDCDFERFGICEPA